MQQQKKNLVDNDKHDPQAKPPVSNWHQQNPNITMVEKLIVLI